MERPRAGWYAPSLASARCRCSSSASAKTSTICGRSSRASSPRRWLVSFSAVAKRYPGGEEALKQVSFAVEPGELVFITGRSGAGKSTLLKLIPAIERPSSGSVIVNGQNVGALKRPSVLLADEPTANLDAESARRIVDIFVEFNRVGVTALIATHDQTLVAQYGKRLLHLEAGRMQ